MVRVEVGEVPPQGAHLTSGERVAEPGEEGSQVLVAKRQDLFFVQVLGIAITFVQVEPQFVARCQDSQLYRELGH